jgi:hypothetical protein
MVVEFIKRTGLGRSSYFNLKKNLGADAQLRPLDVPRFTLTAKPPEAVDLDAEAKAAAEQERRRAEQERLEQQEEQDYKDLEDKYFGDTEEHDEE